MKVKIAMYKWLKYPTWNPTFRFETDLEDKDFIRVSEFVKVDFPEIEVDIVGAEVKAIDETIEEIKAEAMKKVSELQIRKQELLALEHKQ